MSKSPIRSSSKYWVTKLAAVLALLCCGMMKAAEPVPAVTRVTDPCTESEKWVFGRALRKAVPEKSLNDFAAEALTGKEPPFRAFADGNPLSASKDPLAASFGDYWAGRGFFRAKQYGSAVPRFNGILERKPTADLIPVQMAAVACLLSIHEVYPVTVFPDKTAQNLPNFFKPGLVPAYLKAYLWEAGIHLVMRALKAQAAGPAVDKAIALLKGSGPYEDYARAVAAIQRGKPAQATRELARLAYDQKLPRSIQDRQNLLRLMLARVYYEGGKLDDAAKCLDAVDKRSNAVVQALSQQSWVELGRQHYPKAVGTTIALQTGALRTTFAPEAMMVAAISLNELCLFPESLQMLHTFRKSYEKSFHWLRERTGKEAKKKGKGRAKDSEKLYPSALAYLKGEKTKVPDRVASEWIRTPVFLSNQQAINLSFAQERAIPGLIQEAEALHAAEGVKLGNLRLEAARNIASETAKADAKGAADAEAESKKAEAEETRAKQAADAARTAAKAAGDAEKAAAKQAADTAKASARQAAEAKASTKRLGEAKAVAKRATQAEAASVKAAAKAQGAVKQKDAAVVKSATSAKKAADGAAKAETESQTRSATATQEREKAKAADALAKEAGHKAAEAKAKAKAADKAEEKARKEADKAASAAKKAEDKAKSAAREARQAKADARKAASAAEQRAKETLEAGEKSRAAASSVPPAEAQAGATKQAARAAKAAADAAEGEADKARSAAKAAAQARNQAKKQADRTGTAARKAAAKAKSSAREASAAAKAAKAATEAEERAKAELEKAKAEVISEGLKDKARKKASAARDKAIAKAKKKLESTRKKATAARKADRSAASEAKKSAVAAERADADAKAAAAKARETETAAAAADSRLKELAKTESAARKEADKAKRAADKAADALAAAKRRASDADKAARKASSAEADAKKASAKAEALVKKTAEAEVASRQAAEAKRTAAKAASENARTLAKAAAETARETARIVAEAKALEKKAKQADTVAGKAEEKARTAAKQATQAKKLAAKAAAEETQAKQAAEKARAQASKAEEAVTASRAKTAAAQALVQQATAAEVQARKAAADAAAAAKLAAQAAKAGKKAAAEAQAALKKAVAASTVAVKAAQAARATAKKAAAAAEKSARWAAALANPESDESKRMARTRFNRKSLGKGPLAPAIATLADAIEAAETRQERLTRALPVWSKALNRYKAKANGQRERLMERIEEMFQDLNQRMMRQLVLVVENNELIEAEIWNGASQDIVWQNAHPEYEKALKSGQFAVRKPAGEASEVYDWGTSRTLDGEGEIWEDELGAVMANLNDNCSNKERYMKLQRRD